MGSIITPLSEISTKDTLGTDINIPVFIQFTPGYCVQVVHSTNSLREKGDRSINTIIASPHMENPDVVYSNKNSMEENYRYFPLLRNHGDVPTKGDPVLLCTIGKVNYYLGPLNTINNSPTWNDDLNYTPEKIFENNAIGEVGERGLSGESLNFNKKNKYKRLIKLRKEELDGSGGNFVENETTGDYIIEGRHGNSLRIGSRSDNPYIFMSNARDFDNNVESLEDGTLISITSDGTLQQHFGGFIDLESNLPFEGFKLASDISPNNNRNMSDLVTTIPENGENNAQNLIYDYSDNQILFHSDRITLNSNRSGGTGGIYLSSRNDIHIGAGRHLTVSTNNDFIISSERTFIGNPTPNNLSRDMESMVLGDKLKSVLTKIVGLFDKIKIASSGQPAGIQTDPTYQVGVGEEIGTLITEIDNITSTKHFIEPNT